MTDQPNDAPVMPAPGEVPALTSEAFQFAMQVGQAAGAMRMPMDSPSHYGLTLDDGESSTRVQFTDTPTNRFTLAVRNHFGADRALFMAFMLRWFALGRLLKHPQMALYVKDAQDGEALIHTCLFEAAATEPLTDDYEFDETHFFGRLAELYAQDPD